MTEKVIEKKTYVLMREGNHVTSGETADAVMTNSTSSRPPQPTDSVTVTNEVMTRKEGHWMYDGTKKEKGLSLQNYINYS